MKIQYASDLHLEFTENYEFIKKNSINSQADILLLAGDILPFHLIENCRDFFKFCSDNFAFTYWVPGNHEYYYGDISNRSGQFIENIESNVHIVNNKCIIHENISLVFSTLWTPISDNKAWYVQNGLNDYRFIKNKGKLFTTSHSTKLFEENIEFIKDAVMNSQHKKSIVVTHHVPTFQYYPQEYINSDINEAFATDLDCFIENSGIDYWIYGHHHRNVEPFIIGSTHLLTNQLGYVRYNEHENFSLNKIIVTK